LAESLMLTPENKSTENPNLKDLLHGIVDRPLPAQARRLNVTGVADDSRQVQPGGIFVAIRGTATDGQRFVGDALTRGAAVVIGEDLEPTGKALVINVADARATLARLAARWSGIDAAVASGLRLLGITGTNGKTTTAFMTQAILQAGGLRCGILGTVHYDVCGRSVAADMTTPGPLQLADYVRQCADNGAQAAVIEVSSHALDQRRTDGLRFAAAAFTNLTQDHLDYHQTLDVYCRAKSRLFTQLDQSAVAVVNADDPHHRAVLGDCRAPVLRYALENAADISASIAGDTIAGTTYRLRLKGEELELRNALVGGHNVYNALAATGLALAIGMPVEAIKRGLTAIKHVPGRLQRVPGPPGTDVFVDYAHTPDALRNTAGVLRPLTRARLIVVFGCGGDRDRTKRPRMAAAVAEFGDVIIVTSDNPRTEDSRRIIADILTGFGENTRRRVHVEPDRRAAIWRALAEATDGDVVLIAGKGHENYQIVGRERRHFDDVEVALAAARMKMSERENRNP
jgi:UDP-N-acetylmuramoyl-L-alanyl-D-glutamate--2,6-diaminopimelate ligase